MNFFALIEPWLALLPATLMLACAALASVSAQSTQRLWKLLLAACVLASAAALASLALQLFQAHGSAGTVRPIAPGLAVGLLSAWVALLVQGLGAVIARFSARYLEGEPRQARYMAALAGVLAAVQLLVLADHWVVLIAAWAAAGMALHRLLCFYADRPFATLAAHKKFLADRLADACLVGAAVLASSEVGNGSISALLQHVQVQGMNTSLQISAVLLALAVLVRTALLPVHGWLIQVMEAPTPVSALLHAGVVNLGGFVLIRFAPLFELAAPARTLLVVAGLLTAMLAGFVMLTRISIKVRLAWSTLAQMGFMVLECGLGLYQLAMLHLIGHSLYKAHAFLTSGDTVRQAKLSAMRGAWQPALWSLWLAPVLCAVVVLALTTLHAALGAAAPAWPWWWSALLALAWAPMLWARSTAASPALVARRLLQGCLLIGLLTVLALAGHALPLGVGNVPHTGTGLLALAGMALVYLGTAALQLPGLAQRLEPLLRQSYAGFYLDETFTRLALRCWPVQLNLSQHSRHCNRAAAGPTVPTAPSAPAA